MIRAIRNEKRWRMGTMLIATMPGQQLPGCSQWLPSCVPTPLARRMNSAKRNSTGNQISAIFANSRSELYFKSHFRKGNFEAE